VNLLRSLLGQALAALLLLQWIGAPAHCIGMAAAALDGAVICHADGSHGDDGSGGVPVSADQSCPACHALGQAALTPAASVAPHPIAWPAPILQAPRPLAGPTSARAPPQQPRAPPARSV
jgi:hypothetical protein